MSYLYVRFKGRLKGQLGQTHNKIVIFTLPYAVNSYTKILHLDQLITLPRHILYLEDLSGMPRPLNGKWRGASSTYYTVRGQSNVWRLRKTPDTALYM